MEVICLLTNDDEMISITATINDTPVNKGGIWQLKNGTELHMWMVSELHMYAEDTYVSSEPPPQIKNLQVHQITLQVYILDKFSLLKNVILSFWDFRDFSNLIQEH